MSSKSHVVLKVLAGVALVSVIVVGIVYVVRASSEPAKPVQDADAEAKKRQVEEQERHRKQKIFEGLAKAGALWTKGDLDGAAKVLEEFSEWLSTSEEAQKLRAKIMAKWQDVWLEKLKGWLKEGKADEVLSNLAGAALRGVPQKDLDDLRQLAVTLRREAAVKRLRGLADEFKFDEALTLLEKSAEALGPEEAYSQRVTLKNEWLAKIQELVNQGKYEAALQQLKALWKYDPSELGLDKLLAWRGKAAKGLIRERLDQKKFQDADQLIREHWADIKPERERDALLQEIRKGLGEN